MKIYDWGMDPIDRYGDAAQSYPPFKLLGGTFSCTVDLCYEKSYWGFDSPKLDQFIGALKYERMRPVFAAMLENSAIVKPSDTYTAVNIDKGMDWALREGYGTYYQMLLKGTAANPIRIIPNAWGMKSVTLDGKEINYAKDWYGTVERMDNSTAHTLTFEWYPLAQELKDAGYSYRTKCEHYFSGSTAVQQTDTIAADATSHTITIEKGADPKVYSFDLHLNLEKNGSTVGIIGNEHIVKLVVNPAPVVEPDPTLDGTVYYTSGIVFGHPISIAASVTPTTATPAYQWQRSTDSGSTWTNIEGATSGKYTPVAADMGENVRIRVKITAEGYLGEIVGAALKVSKADNDNTPTWPDVVAQKDGSDAYTKFEITNYNPKQEYVYTTSPISGSEWPDGGTKITSATVEELDTGSTYYIYTRYKETDTHTAGSKIRSSSVLVDEINKLNRIILTDESGKEYSSYGSGNTIYIEKGESMTLTAKTNPDGANTWSDFTFKSQYDASAPFSVTAPTASVTSGSTIPSVTIYGNEAGTGTLAAEYPGYPAAQSYGTWRVHVYENVSDIGTGAEITVSPSFPDMTMYQGETMPLPEYTVDVYPEGALENYDLAWRIIKVGMGAAYSESDENITLENDEIKATKKHTGSENTRIALVAINKGNNYISSLSSFYVTVTEAPTVELTGVTVAPTKVNLDLNATYQLSAVKEPVNAAGSLTWTSDKPDVAAVSSTGEVTAKAQGTAIITVTCGTKSASCTVTVGHTHNTDAQPWVYMDPGTHIKTCTAGDDFKVEAHDFSAWTKVDDTNHSRTCSKCKKSGETTNYTETANHNWQWVVDAAATPNAAGKQHEECVDCHAKRSENTEIPMLTSIMVEHLTVAKPVKDAAAAMATTTDSSYTVANTEWMAADGTPLAIGGKFQPGTVYTVKITLETAGAGVFSVKSTYNTIEGKTATVSPNLTGDNHADSVILTYTFDATEGTYVPTKPAITTVALPDGKVGDAYSQTLAATGTNPIAWSIETGTLPDGLTLAGDTIKGTPSKAGNFKFTVKATNAVGSATKELTIKVADAEAAKYHNVTLSGAGTGATGAGSHAAGTTVNIYAGTKSGYTFNGWTSDDVTVLSASSKNASFVMPDNDVTVKANWVYNGGGSGGGGYTYYTIKATAGVNGSISPSGNVSVREGRDQTFTITPDKGYAVAKVLIDSKNVGAVKSYTFENVRKNHTIEVVFMKAGGNPQTGVFVDVATGSYYEDAVDWAVENGITQGTDDTHFSPDGICTRAQAVTFLWRAAGSPAAKSSAMPFTDVKSGSYYYDAVLWAVENGITKGTSATTFSPDQNCSRAQIVTFLWRSEKSPAAGTVNPFTDVKSDAYYADAVLWAVKEDVTKGTTATTFSPDDNCTRAQIVTFIWRALAE
ncbi:MAG: S-layer homology domain-containing protein [Christensenellaceae bacterium]|nr:S-layer homology domain-containing protein [Christensenellaceae bacterium]